MAEIKVERKKQTPIWPWILGILLLLGLIWFLIEAFDGDDKLENEYEEIKEGQTFVPEAEVKTATLLVKKFSRA